MRTTSFEALWKVAEIHPSICSQTRPSKSCGQRFCHENKITATWLTHHKAQEKSVQQARALASTLNGSDKKYHNIQEVTYSETHPRGFFSTILIASELKFVSNKDFISPQNQHTAVRLVARGNFIKWTRMRPETPDQRGRRYLIMVRPQ